MRYIFIVSACDAGGISTYCRSFAEALVQTGAEVHVLFWVDSSSPYSIKQKTFGDIPVAELHYNSLDKCAVNVQRLVHQINFRNSDVVVSQLFPLISDLLQVVRNDKKIFHVEIIHDESEHFLRFAEQAQSTCDLYIAVSNRIACSLNNKIQAVKEFGVPVAICPGGVAVPAKYPEMAHSMPFRVIYVGRLDPVHKRIFDLLKVVGYLIADGVDFHLHIIGGGVALEALKTQVGNMGANKYVSFEGVCSQQEVMEQLNHCHSFILPSAYEGFSIALSEAMAHGLVPIATCVSGSEDAIQDGVNGHLVEIGDTMTMASHLKMLSENADAWRSMSEHAWWSAHENMTIMSRVNVFQHAVMEVTSGKDEKVRGQFYRESSILDARIMPNVATRYIRKTWRQMRGRPSDVATLEK